MRQAAAGEEFLRSARPRFRPRFSPVFRKIRTCAPATFLRGKWEMGMRRDGRPPPAAREPWTAANCCPECPGVLGVLFFSSPIRAVRYCRTVAGLAWSIGFLPQMNADGRGWRHERRAARSIARSLGRCCANGLDRPRNWLERVNEPLTAREIERVKPSIARSQPLGADPWTQRVARRLGLEHTIRPEDRPKKERTDEPREN